MPNLSDYFIRRPQTGFRERLTPAMADIEDRRRRLGTLPGSSQIRAPEIENTGIAELLPRPDLSGYNRLPEDIGLWDIGRGTKRQDRLAHDVGN